MKRCSKCGELLSEISFYRRTASKDGLQAWCKQCQKGYMRVYYIGHPHAGGTSVRGCGRPGTSQYELFPEEDNTYFVRFNINNHNEVLNVLTLLKQRGVIESVRLREN